MKRHGMRTLGSLVAGKNKRGQQKDFTKKNEVSYESKRQAFKRASELLFFNPDMQYFVTLTYRKQHKNYQKVLNDIKNFRRLEPNMKYIGVVEEHKTGNLHIHLITNKIQMHSLRAGKYSAVNWKAGFSDIKHINEFDNNFDVMKYLFKYFQKSNKIGGVWVLKSRNLNRPIQTNREMDYNETKRFLRNLYQSGFSIDKKEVITYNGGSQTIYLFNNKFLTKIYEKHFNKYRRENF